MGTWRCIIAGNCRRVATGSSALYHRGNVHGPAQVLDLWDLPRYIMMGCVLSMNWTCGFSMVSCASESQGPVMHHNGHVDHLELHLVCISRVFSIFWMVGTCLCVITERLLSTVGNLLSVAQLVWPSFRRWAAPAAPTLSSLWEMGSCLCVTAGTPPALSVYCARGANTASWTVVQTLWSVNRSLWHDWKVYHSVDESDLDLQFGEPQHCVRHGLRNMSRCGTV